MTTLPQTTAIRVSRPAGPTAMAVPATPMGGALAASQSQFHMTAADAWRVIRQHIWLIVVMLILSAVGGYFINMLLAKYYSRFTSLAYIQITPSTPVSGALDKEPTLDSTMLAIEQKTQRELLTNEAFLLNPL